MQGFLTKKQRKELLRELKVEREKRYADRLRVILALDKGKRYKEITDILLIDETTVGNYKKRYENGGIEALLNDNYQAKQSFLTEKQTNLLSKELKSKIYPNSQEVIRYIEKTFGVTYSGSGVIDLLHRLGFSYKKPTPVPAKAVRKAQEEFVKEYNKKLKESGVLNYFADSTHPECNPHFMGGWIEKGKTFEVKTFGGRRKRVNIYGVIEINSLQTVFRTYETINQSSVCEMLYLIRLKNPDAKVINLHLDGASYNRAKAVRKRAKELGVNLIYLPPYSPNLNPIERLWKFMKRRVSGNKYYENYDEFEKDLIKFLRGIRKYRPELETLINDNFPIMGT